MNWIDMTLYKTYIKGLLKLTRYFTLHLIFVGRNKIAKWNQGYFLSSNMKRFWNQIGPEVQSYINSID